MKNHEVVVRIRDDERLTELEKLIAKGKKTFVEVGLALAEIRDSRLYRREYSGFEEYCRKKWGWEKRYTQYVIAGAEAVRSLPDGTRTLVHHETAARELTKVDPEQRAGVVQAITDEGKPVTAAEIRRHLPPPPMERRAGDGEPRREPGENPVVDGEPLTQKARTIVHLSGEGTNGAEATEARGVPTSMMPAATPPPPSQVVDATGWPIPTQLIPLWNRSGEVQEMLTVLSRIKGALRSAQENRDLLFAEVCFSSALSQLDQAWTDIKTARPFAVCPTCQGQLPDKCTLCRGRGFISEHRWNMCVPREDKEFRFKAKKDHGTTGPRDHGTTDH
jgi:hypothetical protein